MPRSETHAVVRGTCRFGAQRLTPLIDAFTQEIKSVKTSRDIEHVHRMRVASRRIRAALPLFAWCFPKKRFRIWTKEIQKITRALGEARDLDVQIAFLEDYLNGPGGEATPAVMDTTQAPGQPAPPAAITALVSRMRHRREILQKKVLLALGELEQGRVIEEMQDALREMVPAHPARGRLPPMHAIPPEAAERINKGILDLFEYEPWIKNPDAIAEHHAMRIAAKRLRYMMEIYAPLYRLKLRKPLYRVRKIQTILGDMHDCDVWIDLLTRALVRERTRDYPAKDLHGTDACSIHSHKHLLSDRKQRRVQLHRGFIRYWSSLLRSRFWDDLRASLINDIRVRFSLKQPLHTGNDLAAVTAERAAVKRLAGIYPSGARHARHVTVLALELFDQLLPLHQLGDRDRRLLEYASMLHDIGWKYGRKRHRARSAGMIYSDETLPLDIRERGIVGLVSRFHSGPCRLDRSGYYPSFSLDDQFRIRALTALIRVADGLDDRRLGIVRSVHCIISDGVVTCNVDANGDASVEKARALANADLLNEFFDHMLVIP
ncbi:MAG: hypothetical protein STSR0009_05570 [Methanoregula sp.]